ncbi:hypothetical protein [Dongshaea marina]|uniref:hypothetical protein n=1 Tax=Dongshaea marina TaxID=2047966 RepID=UPI000D3E4CAC|nr:hypothetical protein [Dongshaea marina]
MEGLELQIEALARRLAELKARRNYWVGRSDSHYQKAHEQALKVRAQVLQLFELKNKAEVL